MSKKTFLEHCSLKGQTAIEYLLLLAIVAVIVLLGFTNLIFKASQSTNAFVNKAAQSIMGHEPDLPTH